MLEFKVTRLVQALLSSELSTVEKYLTAPHVVANKECLQLFVQLCKFHPEMDSPKLTKERLFSKVFSKQPYNDGKMRKLMTQLSQAIEQYLMETELKQSEEMRAKLLAQALSERNNYKLFSEVVISRLKTLDGGVGRGRDYFRESFELNEMLGFHPGSAKLTKKHEIFKRAVDDLERFFTLVMLQNEANNIVVTRVEAIAKLSSDYMSTVMKKAQLPSFESINAIGLFHQLVLLLKGEIVENIEMLRAAAFETFSQMSQFEIDFATNLLRNYAIPFANKGSKDHARFIFDLYKMELERGFFANVISAGAFINIVSVALATDEISWTQNFIQSFDHCLPEHERENTINYCWGIWHYRKGILDDEVEEFYNASQSLNLIPTRAGAVYELRVRSTLLRIQFELFERNKETLEELINQVRNFERHLRGNIYYSEPIRNAYLSFLRYFKLLVRDTDARMRKQSLTNKIKIRLINDESSISFKPWLLEKATGLTIMD